MRSRTWFLLSLLFLVGSLYFWLLGNEYSAKHRIAPPASRPVPAATNQISRATPNPMPPLLTRLESIQAQAAASRFAHSRVVNVDPPTEEEKRRFPNRLRNTPKTVDALARTDAALLLKNAFIETDQAGLPTIPEHLRATDDPKSYIVQADGPVTDEFRARLREADASIVSYIPNNAFLVRVAKGGADQLSSSHEVRAVVPYEPYYKLADDHLLDSAVQGQALPEGARLRVTAFPDSAESVRSTIQSLGGQVLAEQRSPFGPQFLVQPASDSLVALAQAVDVQSIERSHDRKLMSDLDRVITGVSENGSTNKNYLGLTGKGVLVNVNDSGIDATHADLAGRVNSPIASTLRDPSGHGTSVAGVLAGNGARSATVGTTPQGSETNANFRGMAPEVNIFALPFDFSPGVTFPVGDTFLQETAAMTNFVALNRTNALISNNSWVNTGARDYDSSAASYDAAVRDALPEMSGAQPIVYVFSAGESGAGSENGLNGDPNSIESPATAKNVITVGASESPRALTNAYYVVMTSSSTNIVYSPPDTSDTNTVVITNTPFLGLTDSSNDVAGFSARGNVGIGLEGTFGRFKPDLVAPGSFVITPRSKDWHLENDIAPDALLYPLLNDLNNSLAPSYRFVTGTSMAAPVVSGILALIQQFFQEHLAATHPAPSPALMKALLINGARSVGPLYDFQVENSINYQGWGLVSLPNVLPSALGSPDENTWPIRFIDQSPTNALATGQSRTWNLTLNTNSTLTPLRVTLVWTDPPGNPNAAIKLVNDLDLVVSNTVSGEVFYGNDIPVANDYTQPSDTNAPPARDIVNNVENVFIREPDGTNFIISVIGRRVNVNAVNNYYQATGKTNDIVQDFALVISTSDLTLTNAFTLAAPQNGPGFRPPVSHLTNGVPVLNQRVGANQRISDLSYSPGSSGLLETTRGVTNQWQFYTFTNTFDTNASQFTTLTNGTNVAFVTFVPPNLSKPRNFEADIDLYVSKDARLLDLNPTVVAAADKSVGRDGTEAVVYTNANIGDVYYIGVKSSDQQGGEFSLISISSDIPFDRDVNGSRVLQGFPIRANIPDGTAALPGIAQVLAIGLDPKLVQRVVVTNAVSQESFGDLLINLSHNRQFVVLENHTLPNNQFRTNIFIYDDSGLNDIQFSQHSDGPGSLQNFTSEPISGVWLMTAVDNSPGGTGRLENVILRVDPIKGGDLNGNVNGLDGTVAPGETIYYYTDVPTEVTNLVIRLSQIDNGALDVRIRGGDLPTPDENDKAAHIAPPGGDLAISAFDTVNPLVGGRYYVSVSNPNAVTVNYHIQALFDYDLGLNIPRVFGVTNVALLDDALIRSAVDVPVDRLVSDIEVQLGFTSQARASDYVFRLVSPRGTRVVLAENRGGATSLSQSLTAFYGGPGYSVSQGALTQAFNGFVFTENTNRFIGNTTNRWPIAPIKFAVAPADRILEQKTNLFFVLPEESMKILQGEPTIGQWTLEAQDTRTGNGTNNLALGSMDWQVNFTYVPPPAPANFLTNKVTFSGTLVNDQVDYFVVDVCESASIAVNTLVGPLTDPTGQVGDVVLMADRSGLPTGGDTDDYFPVDNIGTNAPPGFGSATLQFTRTLPEPAPLQPGGRYFLAVRNQFQFGVTNAYTLQVTFDRDTCQIPVIRLTNNIPYTNIIAAGSDFDYYVFNVATNACETEFTLSPEDGDLALYLRRAARPNTTTFHRVSDNPGITNEVIVISTNTPVLISPGDWYLGVQNKNTNTTSTNTVHYSIVAKELICSNSGGNGQTNYVDPIFVTITNGNICISWAAQIGYDYYIDGRTNLNDSSPWVTFYPRFTATETTMNVCFPLTNMPYRFFRVAEISPVTNPTGREEVPVNVRIVDGSVCLDWLSLIGSVYHVEEATNVFIPDPNWIERTSLTATNTNTTYCIVLTNTLGWPNPTYFRVTRETSLPGGIVALTNNVFYTNSIAAGTNQIEYYSFDIPTNAISATFELFPTNGNLGLVVNKGQPLPTRTDFDFISDRLGTSNEVVTVDTNSLPPISSGTWYLGVFNNTTNAVNYSVRASFQVVTEPPPTNLIANIEIVNNNICFTWSSIPGHVYRVQAKLSDTNDWEQLAVVVATSTSTEECVPLGYRFYQVIEDRNASITPLTSGVLSTNSIAGSTNLISYFRFNVATNATNAVFELFPKNGDLGLLVKKADLPGLTNFNYRSDLAGTNTAETITVRSGVGQVPLSAGDWYLGVYSKTTNSVTYTVRATQFLGTQTPPQNQLVITPTISNGRLVFSWPNTTGGAYVLEYKTNLFSATWTSLTNIAASANPVITVTDPNSTTNGPLRFYRVRPVP